MLNNGGGLEVFKNLTGSDFVIALVNLGVYLASLQDFSVFGVEIPALEQIAGQAGGLRRPFSAVRHELSERSGGQPG